MTFFNRVDIPRLCLHSAARDCIFIYLGCIHSCAWLLPASEQLNGFNELFYSIKSFYRAFDFFLSRLKKNVYLGFLDVKMMFFLKKKTFKRYLLADFSKVANKHILAEFWDNAICGVSLIPPTPDSVPVSLMQIPRAKQSKGT